MVNAAIWICLGSVANIAKDYFQVTYISINWLGMIYSVLSPGVVLAVYMLNKYGLKVIIVGAALCNLLSTSCKLIGYGRNGYVYQLIGNGFAALGSTLVIFSPPTVAATWFGESERARASAIGTAFNAVGVAIGFLMGSMLIPASNDYEGVVQRGVLITLLLLAIFSFILLIVSIIFVEKNPPTPPTVTQSIYKVRKLTKKGFQTDVPCANSEIGTENNAIQCDELENVIGGIGKQHVGNKTEDSEIQNHSVNDTTIQHSTGLLKNFKSLVKMLSFHLLVHSYALYFGLVNTVNNILNQMCIKHFPSKEKLIGIMGFTNILLGLLGSVICGILIDKTRRYKIISIGIFGSSAVSFLAFTFALTYSGNFALTFASLCIYGVFSTPFLTVGLEYMAEITYPVKESNLTFIMFLFANAYCFILTYVLGNITVKFGSDIAGYIIAGIYCVGLFLMFFVRSELKRIKVDSGMKDTNNVDNTYLETNGTPE